MAATQRNIPSISKPKAAWLKVARMVAAGYNRSRQTQTQVSCTFASHALVCYDSRRLSVMSNLQTKG